MQKIQFIKDSTAGETQWFIEVDGKYVGEIAQEREQFAHATSRARGTKVVGYAATIETTDATKSEWFPANDNACAALKAAKDYAKQMIGGAA